MLYIVHRTVHPQLFLDHMDDRDCYRNPSELCVRTREYYGNENIIYIQSIPAFKVSVKFQLPLQNYLQSNTKPKRPH